MKKKERHFLVIAHGDQAFLDLDCYFKELTVDSLNAVRSLLAKKLNVPQNQIVILNMIELDDRKD